MYSQLNQDLWVLDILQHKQNGVFVDVGAFDGINLSNTYLLEKQYNWNGICIEANCSTFKKLEKCRNCVCVNELLSDEKDKVLPFQNLGELSFGVENVLNVDIAEIRNNNDNLDTSMKFLTTNTLENVLNEHNIPNVIDYLSIDVEGMEYEILKNFDFNRYHINTLTVEHNAAHIGDEYRNKLFYLLSNNNFKFVKGNDNVHNWDKYYIEDFYVNTHIKN